MAKVAAFTLDGYELIFYPKDHKPEHFHLVRLGYLWEIKVLFMLCTNTHLEIRSKKPSWWAANYNPLPKNKTRILLELISEHQDALKAQWDELQGEEGQATDE
jgi:hypothetical protein